RGTRIRFVDLRPSELQALEQHLELFDEPTQVGIPRVTGRTGQKPKKVLEGLLIVEDDPEGTEFRLRSTDRLIGRDPRQVDFVLNHPSVSRRHAHIVNHNGRHVINDLSSTNGIRFRGKQVRTLVLRDGMVFQIGKVRLQYLVTREV
ncbi:MAG: FHA domain-containing protein, partial [Deltaproteobacteria bacterium]